MDTKKYTIYALISHSLNVNLIDILDKESIYLSDLNIKITLKINHKIREPLLSSSQRIDFLLVKLKFTYFNNLQFE